MNQKKKINKGQFLRDVASHHNLNHGDVVKVYNAIVDELQRDVGCGYEVSLTGFGVFSLKKHKGHRVQFGNHAVEDYVNLKFSAAGVLNRKLRDKYRNGEIKSVEDLSS